MAEIDWRQMPALAALRAFAAAAAQGGFSAAARQLNVTPAAVAQQVRALEAELGVALVWRDGRGLRLTPEGEKLAASLSEGFATIQSGLAAARQGAGPRPLSVTLPPAFATQWLMPRLGRFWKAHPDVALSLLPDHRVLDLRAEGVELGIRYGDGHWPGVSAEFLTPAHYIVVAAPDLLTGTLAGRQLSPADMAALPWVRERDWPEQTQWLEAIGLDPKQLRFTEFPTEELALEAARQGFGLHVESATLIEADLNDGTLIKVHDFKSDALGYYIVSPTGLRRPAAQAFVQWLKAEV
ncbi:LysR family transcriptional regulator [Phaeovulum sp. W22_SRMD_FR3]|uniref:LysR family transcriptional regulator n=1 Tax=Phaeovulum sp. W22_SRMD_FR3 TaxID=3240274 RepID=UPI003F9534DF